MRAYRVAYDGTPYHGFQRQPDVDTVEDQLCEALAALGVTSGGVPQGYAAAGRTDARVSAVAQTVAFDAPEWLSPQAFNSELPDSIRVWASVPVPDDFHATHHAVSRAYTYVLAADGIDTARLDAALDTLAGEHNFHNLTPDETGTTRQLSTALTRDGDFFELTFRAGGFPRQFVRRAVTLVAAIGRNERPLAFLDRVLSADTLAGPDGLAPAFPDSLVMTDVSYSNVSFTRDQAAAATAQKLFENRARERAARARVATILADVGTNP
jgi:tRNA pseudouridine38-40 synthase